MNSSFKIMARRILPLRRGDPAIKLSNDNCYKMKHALVVLCRLRVHEMVKLGDLKDAPRSQIIELFY